MIALLLFACTADERTAVVIGPTGEGLASVASNFAVYIDPVSPYVDADGVALTASDNACLGDWVLDDADLECRIFFAATDAGFEEVEVQPGYNGQGFTFSAAGWSGDVQTVTSATYGPVEFAKGEVQHVELPLAPLESAIDGCHDLADNDGDGWHDADDPDCAAGTSEEGTGSAACNNGGDDDSDGLVDSDDPDCDGASDASEAGPCADAIDNDGDGWLDGDDPDCADLGTEVGPGSTECNDGEDNDGDEAADSDDPDCDSALDDDEITPPCDDRDDNDGDGWIDSDDPDCLSGSTEVGTSDFACND
ncbi:MAG: hypothetical protein FJ102_01745, partial [Deltaproteobacteria bacterium]|nr:hypothetical protein [Deltaproteobacteria bacterium]